jgi:hypothetical protein
MPTDATTRSPAWFMAPSSMMPHRQARCLLIHGLRFGLVFGDARRTPKPIVCGPAPAAVLFDQRREMPGFPRLRRESSTAVVYAPISVRSRRGAGFDVGAPLPREGPRGPEVPAHFSAAALRLLTEHSIARTHARPGSNHRLTAGWPDIGREWNPSSADSSVLRPSTKSAFSSRVTKNRRTLGLAAPEES